jgi:hypothetical protein
VGLDTVELVIEVEQTFDIVIDDRDAEQITTVGGLYQYVLTRLEGKASPTPTCKSAAVFFRLRRALCESLGIERERVRLSTAIEDLIPSEIRASTWPKLQQAVDLRLPGLGSPGSVVGSTVVAILTSLVIMMAIAFAGTLPGFPIQAALWSFLVVALLAAVLIPIATRPLAVCLPEECQSVRGLVVSITSMNYGRIHSGDRRWNEVEAWDALCSLISTLAGIAVSELTEETRFVDDLGMD